MNSKEIKISEERILKTAEEYPDSKRALVSLFTELFEDDNAVFCRLGDLLVCKKTDYFYNIRLRNCGYYYELFNCTMLWDIGSPVKKKGFEITAKMFKEMLSTTNYKIEDFKVVKAEDVKKLYFND